MSRLTIILVVTGLLVVGAAATIFVSLPPSDGAGALEASEPATSSDAEKRQRAEKFLGGDPDRNVRGGQEMKPRW